VEAFALPDGTICIHTGLLARLENEAQLAFLLAHEMTHCTHSHALRTLWYIENKVADSGDPTGSVGGHRLLTLFGTTGSMENIRSYTQELESEADLVGLGLIIKAGYDPGEALGLLEFDHLELGGERTEARLPAENQREIRRRKEYCKHFISTEYGQETAAIDHTKQFLTELQKVILDNSLLDIRAGRFHSAETNLEKYLAARPDDPRAHYLLGEVSRQRSKEGDQERGKAHYNRALSLDPSYPDPHRGIGLIYYRSGDKALSVRHFESYLALSPQAPDTAYIRDHLTRMFHELLSRYRATGNPPEGWD
jgi:predicted Zn-dependent protease